MPRLIRGLGPLLAAALVAGACAARPEAPSLPTPVGPGVSVSQAVAGASTPGVEERTTTLSEEESREELKRVRFSTHEWPKTNFRTRSVPLKEFRGGGPPKDGIPAVDQPKFETVEQADKWLEDREPVQVVEIQGDARAYPVQIMMWHEIVNDTVGGEAITITF